MSMKQLKPDTWLLDVRVYKGALQYRKRETFIGGKKDAEGRYQELRKELKQRAKGERSLTVEDFRTFKEVLDFYLENKASPKSRADSYFKRLRTIDATPLDRLSKVFKEFVRLERKSCSSRTGEPLTDAAINKLKVFASAALNYAVEEEKIQENPLKGIKKDDEKLRWIILDRAQERALLDAVKEVSPAILPFVTYIVDVPCRKGEMLRAGNKCFDNFSNTIEIPGNLTKNGEPCAKPVPAGMVQYFRANPSPWLFYREERGEYKPLGFIQKAWGRAVKRACLDDLQDNDGNSIGALRIHDLRHHAISKLIAAGNSRSNVIAVSGWKHDMLSVYWNFKDTEIAKSIVFQEKPYTQTVHFPEIASKTA